ncbi:MAG: hypothetical protein ACLFPQ_03280 [Candidatus Woesearchaeota archaeon]
MKKIAILINVIFMISVLIFAAGCQNTTNNGSIGDFTPQGTKGLTMTFVENAPPDDIYVESGATNDVFETTIELKNQGSYPKEEGFEGKLYIGGFDETVITSGGWDGGEDIPTTLNGKSQFFPEGGYEIKSYFADINYGFDSNSYRPTILVTACYNYQTRASPLVCIDPTPTSTTVKNKICTMSDVSMSGGQGGPVSVTSLEQSGNSQKTIFKIHIQNQGGGQVIPWDAYDRCQELTRRDIDTVQVQVSASSLGNGQCTPAGTSDQPVRLQNGRGVIVCTFDNPLGRNDAYTTPLDITLSYGYSESIMKQVNIIKID